MHLWVSISEIIFGKQKFLSVSFSSARGIANNSNVENKNIAIKL